MLLAIDAGNTNIVFAVYSLKNGGQEQLEQCRIETTGNIPDTLNIIAQKYTDIKDVVVSSVVPNVNDAIEKSCTYLLKIDPVFVTYQNAGIDIGLDKPEEIGADRLVNAVAVLAHYQSPAVIVDFGTATTFDVIDVKGVYSGGAIAPGINLSLQALQQAAAKLPEIAIEKPEKVIGGDTKEAMQSGIYWGYIGLIEGTLQRIAKEMGGKPYVIGTGGLASLFATGTDVIDTLDLDLTLKGLVHIHGQSSHGQSSQDDNRKSAEWLN